MMIQILRNTVADGEIARAGQIISVRYETGMELIGIGKAVEYKEQEPLKNRASGLSVEEQPKIQKRRGRPRLSDKK